MSGVDQLIKEIKNKTSYFGDAKKNINIEFESGIYQISLTTPFYNYFIDAKWKPVICIKI